MAEYLTFNQSVAGSNPAVPITRDIKCLLWRAGDGVDDNKLPNEYASHGFTHYIAKILNINLPSKSVKVVVIFKKMVNSGGKAEDNEEWIAQEPSYFIIPFSVSHIATHSEVKTVLYCPSILAAYSCSNCPTRFLCYTTS